MKKSFLKTKWYILPLALALLMTFSLTACKGPVVPVTPEPPGQYRPGNAEKLDRPTGLTLGSSGGVDILLWNEVHPNGGYFVEVTGSFQAVNDNGATIEETRTRLVYTPSRSCDFEGVSLIAERGYSARVMAVAASEAYTNSDWSLPYWFTTSSDGVAPKRLAKPEGLYYEYTPPTNGNEANHEIGFDFVVGADYYLIRFRYVSGSTNSEYKYDETFRVGKKGDSLEVYGCTESAHYGLDVAEHLEEHKIFYEGGSTGYYIFTVQAMPPDSPNSNLLPSIIAEYPIWLVTEG